ncbi:uncharacterized protein MONBRDRAFT_22541 [Monosiga brevicollis MX1]|uniref:Uncharacterized protein n=1 Tax=Monosiga brevicollis TaxID=81824 RepID=A9UQW1_MONBE|nr:uncharacterized protein MONBRDRAFT_22541 [Monosiga brevicollis MX1]EDQ93114.1 predicted protein [Monosiga brevicollis MX1]|eukprot:XP_001742876.1 hypothetical protein [Monosiga brevicollis MX1]
MTSHDENVRNRIERLEHEIFRHPQDFDNHIRYIKACSEIKDSGKLQAAREKFARLFPLPQDVWMEWLDDAREGADTLEQMQSVLDLYKQASADGQLAQLRLDYLDYCKNFYLLQGQGSFQDDGIAALRALYAEQLAFVGHHFTTGLPAHKRAIDFETDLLRQLMAGGDEAAVEAQFGSVIEAYRRLFRVPVQGLADEFERFETWCEELGIEVPDDIEETFEQTMTLVKVLTPLEMQLKKAKDGAPAHRCAALLVPYQQSAELCLARAAVIMLPSHPKPAFVMGMDIAAAKIADKYDALRAAVLHSEAPNKQKLALGYCLRQAEAQPKEAFPWVTAIHHALAAPEEEYVVNLALRAVPGAHHVWCLAFAIRDGHNQPLGQLTQLAEQALKQQFGSADAYIDVWMHFLTVVVKRQQQGEKGVSEEDWARHRDTALTYLLDYLGGWLSDPQHRLVSCLPLLNKRVLLEQAELESRVTGDSRKGREMLDMILQDEATRPLYATWKAVIAYERQHNASIEALLELHQEAFEAVQDYGYYMARDYQQLVLTTSQADPAIVLRLFGSLIARPQEVVAATAAHSESGSKKPAKSAKRSADDANVEPRAKKTATQAATNSATEAMDTSAPRGATPTHGAGDESAPVAPRQAHKVEAEDRTVFVKNLDFSVTEDELRARFADCGEIVDVRMPFNHKGKAKGYAYLEFASASAVNPALSKDRQIMGTRPMLVDRYVDRSQMPSLPFKHTTDKNPKSLFVKNLDYKASEAEIKDLFNKHGAVEAVRLVTKFDGSRRDFCYVDFVTEADAAKAQAALDGHMLHGRALRVNISKPPGPLRQTLGGGRPTLGGGPGSTKSAYLTSRPCFILAIRPRAWCLEQSPKHSKRKASTLRMADRRDEHEAGPMIEAGAEQEDADQTTPVPMGIEPLDDDVTEAREEVADAKKEDANDSEAGRSLSGTWIANLMVGAQKQLAALRSRSKPSAEPTGESAILDAEDTAFGETGATQPSEMDTADPKSELLQADGPPLVRTASEPARARSSGPDRDSPVSEAAASEPPHPVAAYDLDQAMSVPAADPLPPLGADQVRWYFNDPYIAVGLKTKARHWEPFCCHDARRLESLYQRQLQTLRAPITTDPPAATRAPTVDREEVRGGLYEVEVLSNKDRRHIAWPIYWDSEEPLQVTRGTWFEKSDNALQPLDETLADAIEAEHVTVAYRRHLEREMRRREELAAYTRELADPERRRRSSKPKTGLEELHRLDMVGGKTAIWYGIEDIRLCDTIASWAPTYAGRSIYRGHAHACHVITGARKDDDDSHCRCGKAEHLVLVIHGIGQAYEQTIVEMSAYLRNMSQAYAKAGHLDNSYQQGHKHVDFLPIEWRTSLALDGGTIDAITPPGVEVARRFLNNGALDVLYFTSPKFCQEIMDSVTDKLNAVYAEYTRRHPDFERNGGKVSIVAHSLGGVISHALLTHQDSAVEMEDDMREAREEHARLVALRREINALKMRARRRKAGHLLKVENEKKPKRDVTGQHLTHAFVRVNMRNLAAGPRGSLSLTLPEVEDVDDILDDQPEDMDGDDEDHGDPFDEPTADTATAAPPSPSASGQPSLHPMPAIFSKLHFPVRQLFTLGSPISIFLTMRGARSKDQKKSSSAMLLPPNTRLYNIYHSADPLAYRLEPLLQVEPHDDPVNVPDFELGASGIFSVVSKTVNPFLKTLNQAATTISQWRAGRKQAVSMLTLAAAVTESAPDDDDLDEARADSSDASSAERPSQGSSIAQARGEVVRVSNQDRTDFVVAGGAGDVGIQSLQYLSLLSAHTDYWYRWDVTHFINQTLINGLGLDREV